MATVTNRGRSLPRFPATVAQSGPITATQTANNLAAGADFRPLQSAGPSYDTASLTVLQDATTGAFAKATLANILRNRQPLDAKLAAFAAFSDTAGLVEQTGAEAFTKRLIGVANSTDIPARADADSRFQPLDADLTAVAGLSSNGLVARTGAGTAAVRTLTGTSGRVSVTNGDGVSGNPTVDWDGIQVRKNSTGSTFTRRRLNLIEGTSITLAVSDDAGGDEVDVTVSASGFPSFQTTQTVDTTNRSTTSTSYVTSNVSASITPSSASNRVRVTVQGIAGFSAVLVADFTLDRSGTLLTPAGVNSFATLRPATSDVADSVTPFSFSFVDSPATTSSRTYSLFWKTNGGTLYLGRRGSDTNIDTVSAVITLQEIPA